MRSNSFYEKDFNPGGVGCVECFILCSIHLERYRFPFNPKDGMVHELYDTIYNNTSSPGHYLGQNHPSHYCRDGQVIAICDATVGAGSCYGWSAASPHTLVIAANVKATLDVQIKAATTASDGCSYVTLTTKRRTYPLTFKICAWPTAVERC
ncbi:hypothetical protein EMGBS15_19010 [Filimonas sp.]|nr:hypothetical protein EMGBS15_19010 [Filimonas sp.]